MKLSSYITQINQNIVGNVEAGDTSALEQGLKNGMEAVLGKLPGQSITGEVVFRDGSDILISMGKNQLLQAKLEGAMNTQIGQLLTFQIKNNSSAKVVLTPLFENLSQDPNVSKALAAAGLPENDVTAAMVKAMMQEGLPVNRQSLYQMNRYVNANPQADIQTLVQMQRLSLPITPENIFQFEAYKNYQHQLGESLSDITDAFLQTFQEITGQGNLSEGLNLFKEVLGVLVDETQAALEEGKPSIGEAPEGAVLEAEDTPANGNTSLKEGLLPNSERDELVRQLKQAGAPEELRASVANGKISGQDFLKNINELLSKGALPDREAAFEMLKGKAFKHILKNEMNRQWLLLPEEVADEHSVDKLYERLNSQMNRLSQMLSETGRADTPLAKAVSNVTGNIDFMNQLNQMFTYVQLPLKMQNQGANGELFVYTNKKSLAKKDDSVSALLHLDMEHLGSMDVYVALNNQKVSTKFYLQDDKALDLIAQNIGILNERLESRGYSMNAEFINKEEKTNVMEEILKKDKNISVLAGYSFDARA